MARGYQDNEDHKTALAALGRPLARRARSHCELCEASGVPLSPWEVPPEPAEPDEDRCLLLCGPCREAADGAALDAHAWRFLEGVVWAELPAAQVLALRLLGRLADDGESWAADALDGVVVDEDVRAWADGATPDGTAP